MHTENTDINLSPEEIEVNNILNEASQRIEQIDIQLNSPPPLQGPGFRPSGPSFGGWTEAQRQHYKKTLEYQKELVKAQAKEQAVKVLEKSSLDAQLRVYNKIDDWAEPKPDRTKDIKGRTERSKDISASQDVAMLKLHDLKQENMLREQINIKTDASKTIEPPESGSSLQSLSERYSATLHYNNRQEKDEKTPDKSDKEIDIDKG